MRKDVTEDRVGRVGTCNGRCAGAVGETGKEGRVLGFPASSRLRRSCWVSERTFMISKAPFDLTSGFPSFLVGGRKLIFLSVAKE